MIFLPTVINNKISQTLILVSRVISNKNHIKRNNTISLANQMSMIINEESMIPKVETNHHESNMAICRAITQSLPTTRLALNDSNGYST